MHKARRGRGLWWDWGWESCIKGVVRMVRANKLFNLLLLLALFSTAIFIYFTGTPLFSAQSNARLQDGLDPVLMNLSRFRVLQDWLVIQAEQGPQGRRDVQMAIPVGGVRWRSLKQAIEAAEKKSFPWKPYKAQDVDCRKLFKGDAAEIARVNELTHAQSLPNSSFHFPSDDDVSVLAKHCPSLIAQAGFVTSSLTEEEKTFPIAFSLLAFKTAHQVLDLLRAIYRPQNHYCVHVDLKSPRAFRRAMAAIADCFPNVFLSSRSVDVRWGTFSVLEPELVCMRDLWRFSWRYFINLTGQEFPLKTNLELVRILRVLNGTNSLEGTIKRANKDRWANLGAPPGGIVPVKGSVHVAVNRDFVDFILHNSTALTFLNWTAKVSVPDEVFFSSLNHNPHLGIRGTYKGAPETDPVHYPFLARFKNWGGHPFNYPCASGRRVRLVCILSAGDLPLLARRPELFANKFYADFSKYALQCLAERLFNRTQDEYFGNVNFDTGYYRNLTFIHNVVERSSFNTSS